MSNFYITATDGPAPYELNCSAFLANEVVGDSIASFTAVIASGPGVLGSGLKAPVVQDLTKLIYWMDFSAAEPETVTVLALSITTTSGRGPFHTTIEFTAR
jgi:hypothetical protein